VTDNAYIQMALVGKGFCTSCLVGLGILVRHPILATVVGRCSAVFRLVGPLGVMSLTGLVAWPILGRAEDLQGLLFSGGLSNAFAPLVCVMILGFVIGELMMFPYATVSKTIFHAYSADEEMEEHHGGALRPPHMPPPIQHFFREHC